MALGLVSAVSGLASRFGIFNDKTSQPEKYLTFRFQELVDGEYKDDESLYITLDVVEEINIKMPTRVSKKPTSEGRVTDNIHNDPIEVSFTGFISNASVTLLDAGKIGARVTSLLATNVGLDPLAQGLAAEAVMAVGGFEKSTSKAYETLKQIRDKRGMVSISTSLETFTGMVFESIDIPINYEVGDSLRIEAKAIKLPVVTTKAIASTFIDLEDNGGAASSKDLGGNSTKSVRPSILTSLF
jgi:hypothetical protein